MSSGPRISSTFTKRTETEVPDNSRSQAPAVVRAPVPLKAVTNEGQKATIALGESDLEAIPTPPLALEIPSDFSIRRGVVLCGRFRVKEIIGAGAQCYVYSAEHTTLKSQVAIKCLQPALVTPDLVERFAREAQALTAIRNAHVAAVLDVGRAPCGTPFIVMEYLQGRDLGALLETRPRLEPRQATEIVLQTCEGLAAAHALGLVHQDIKPSNIFLSDEMGIVKAKVVDFGVARVALEKTTSPNAKFSRSRLDDEIGGTPFYMSPDQLSGSQVIDPRSDIFSLGMVLYEMLRGTNAFDLEMSTRRGGEAVRIERAGIDPGLVEIIEKCLAHRPLDRYSSVAELAVALLPYAPSRARAHAEAATALLRKAGHSVASTLPSSVPPPARSLAPPMTVPGPPALPGDFEAKLGAKQARSKKGMFAAIGAVAVVGLAAAGYLVTRAQTPTASAATNTAATTNGSAIGITKAMRGAPQGEGAPGPGGAAPGATQQMELAAGPSTTANGPLGAASNGKKGPPPKWATWPPPKPGASGAAPGAPNAASASGAKPEPAAAAPPPAAEAPKPKPAATSEDLGF